MPYWSRYSKPHAHSMLRSAERKDGTQLSKPYIGRERRRSPFYRVYRLKHRSHQSGTCAAPPVCTLVRVDSEVLKGLHREARRLVESRIATFWSFSISFSPSGIVYGLLRGPELLGLCISGFVTGGVHSIDINTPRPFRGRGYAYTVGNASVAECVQRGRAPYWDRMETNRASTALAEKPAVRRTADRPTVAATTIDFSAPSSEPGC